MIPRINRQLEKVSKTYIPDETNPNQPTECIICYSEFKEHLDMKVV